MRATITQTREEEETSVHRLLLRSNDATGGPAWLTHLLISPHDSRQTWRVQRPRNPESNDLFVDKRVGDLHPQKVARQFVNCAIHARKPHRVKRQFYPEISRAPRSNRPLKNALWDLNRKSTGTGVIHSTDKGVINASLTQSCQNVLLSCSVPL